MSGGGVAAAGGQEGRMRSVLVCYASRYGSTREIAGWIADELRGAGFIADCLPAGKEVHPAAYDAAVIGSALYMGKWLAEARELVSRERIPLGRMPVAVFSVGYSLKELTRPSLQAGEAALSDISLFIAPRDAAFFPGKVDPERVSPADRAILSLAGIPGGDFCDADLVRAWARTLPALLGLIQGGE
ncbi:MAG TPA: flavodoxin domain-containing protein [Methanolinea sp.]|nr:flavodoxin domain-containing protein [Methanolinea sp.]